MLALALRIFFYFRLASVTRGQPYKILKRHCICTSRSTFFAERVINVWNSLPCDTVDFSVYLHLNVSLNGLFFPGFFIFLSWVSISLWILASMVCIIVYVHWFYSLHFNPYFRAAVSAARCLVVLPLLQFCTCCCLCLTLANKWWWWWW